LVHLGWEVLGKLITNNKQLILWTEIKLWKSPLMKSITVATSNRLINRENADIGVLIFPTFLGNYFQLYTYNSNSASITLPTFFNVSRKIQIVGWAIHNCFEHIRLVHVMLLKQRRMLFVSAVDRLTVERGVPYSFALAEVIDFKFLIIS
jgi:hypothetical protein